MHLETKDIAYVGKLWSKGDFLYTTHKLHTYLEIKEVSVRSPMMPVLEDDFVLHN